MNQINNMTTNFLQEIGLSHCFYCHTDHELGLQCIYTGNTGTTPCTEKCGKRFKTIEQDKDGLKIVPSWEESKQECKQCKIAGRPMMVNLCVDCFKKLEDESNAHFLEVSQPPEGVSEEWEKEFDKKWMKLMIYDDRELRQEENDIQHQKEIKDFISNLLSTQHKELIEKIWDMLIMSLPSDAENLSTLLPDQSHRLIKEFIKKLKALEDIKTKLQ